MIGAGRSCPDLGDFQPPTLETLPEAVARNVAIARARTRARIMAVVKAAGLTVPILTWLNPSGVDAEAAAAGQIDIAIGSADELEALLKHASSSVRVHLNLDTGMAREGCPMPE